MKHRPLWLLVSILLGMAVWVAATTVMTNPTHEIYAWNGPVASADTLLLTPSWRDSPTEIDYIRVANIAGGTATNANVAIVRRNRTIGGDLVVWQSKVLGGPVAAPALAADIAQPGGVFRSGPGDTLKIAMTMASATSLYVACRYHQGR